MTEPSGRLRLAVLASGGGRSLENLVVRSEDGSLPATVELVIANTPKAFALERARNHGITAEVIRPRDFPDAAAFGERLFATLDAVRIDLALLAGFLVRVPLVPRWRNRVMNIHPALLPAFGGAGYYGHRVHDAVLAAGEKASGCTVHFVDDEYDNGPIILQRTVPVLPDDDADRLAARVFEAEKEAYPEAVRLFAAKRLEVSGGRVTVKPA